MKRDEIRCRNFGIEVAALPRFAAIFQIYRSFPPLGHLIHSQRRYGLPSGATRGLSRRFSDQIVAIQIFSLRTLEQIERWSRL